MHATTDPRATAPDLFKQRQPIPRLPGGDRTTQRLETAVFTSLSLAAGLTIGMALVEVTKFVAGSGQIAAALSARQQSLAAAPPAPGGKNAVTNAVAPAGSRAGASRLSPGKV